MTQSVRQLLSPISAMRPCFTASTYIFTNILVSDFPSVIECSVCDSTLIRFSLAKLTPPKLIFLSERQLVQSVPRIPQRLRRSLNRNIRIRVRNLRYKRSEERRVGKESR